MNQAGFSLVEVIISSAILSIAMVGASMEFAQQIEAESAMNTQLGARVVMNQVISTVFSGASQFPYMQSSANPGNSIIYVTCYRDDGSQLPAINPSTTGSVGVALSTNIPTGPAPNGGGLGACTWTTPGTVLWGIPLGPCVCQQNQGGYEAHVVPLSPHSVRVDVITLTNGLNAGVTNPAGIKDARSFVVGSRVTSSGTLSL